MWPHVAAALWRCTVKDNKQSSYEQSFGDVISLRRAGGNVERRRESKVVEERSVPTWNGVNMASIQEPEVQFAQRLASNEKPIRTKAVKKLRKYINVRSQKATGKLAS